MNTEPVRVGVIGLGKMGMLHSAILNALEGAALVAACEQNDSVRSGFEAFVPDVRFYRDHGSMLENEDLDAVFITTPTSSHAEIGMACLRRGCHLFIEKPLSVDAPSGQPLVQEVKKRHVVTMVGFMMRHVSTFQRAHSLLQEEAIGRRIAFGATVYTSQLFASGKGWRYSRKASGGGVIMMQGIHALDLIAWYFGYPNAINARTNAHYSKEIEDFGHVSMAWDTGLTGWLDCSWSVDNHRLMETSIKVTGEKGTLWVTDDFIRLYLREPYGGRPAGFTVETGIDLHSGVPIDIGGPQYTREDEAFVRAVRSGKPVENDIANSYCTQVLLDAVYDSAAGDGCTVRLPGGGGLSDG